LGKATTECNLALTKKTDRGRILESRPSKFPGETSKKKWEQGKGDQEGGKRESAPFSTTGRRSISFEMPRKTVIKPVMEKWKKKLSCALKKGTGRGGENNLQVKKNGNPKERWGGST